MWPEHSVMSALAPLHVVGKGAWVAEVWHARLRRENRCPLIRAPALNSLLACPQLPARQLVAECLHKSQMTCPRAILTCPKDFSGGGGARWPRLQVPQDLP